MSAQVIDTACGRCRGRRRSWSRWCLPGGPNYWDYANLFSTMVCSSLQDSLGTDFGLTNIEGYNHVGDEPLYNVGPLDREFNYGDCPPDNVLAPEMFWLADPIRPPERWNT